MTIKQICSFNQGGATAFVYVEDGKVMIQWRNFRNPINQWDETLRKQALEAIGLSWVNGMLFANPVRCGEEGLEKQELLSRAESAEASAKHWKEKWSDLQAEHDRMIEQVLFALNHECSHNW